jgi:hypothetical protein
MHKRKECTGRGYGTDDGRKEKGGYINYLHHYN